MFFDQIIGQITKAKGIDRLVGHSENIQQVKAAILGSSDAKGDLLKRIKTFATQYGVTSNDLKNLSIANLLLNLKSKASGSDDQGIIQTLFSLANDMGLADKFMD